MWPLPGTQHTARALPRERRRPETLCVIGALARSLDELPYFQVSAWLAHATKDKSGGRLRLCCGLATKL